MTTTPTRAGAPGGPPPAVPPGQDPGQAPPGSGREPRSGVAGLLDLPGEAFRRIAEFARRTPGRLSVIAVGLVVLSAVVAVVGAMVVQDRKNTIDGLIEHREPLAAAAQQVYGSLSDADATAASAFLYTGSEPLELRQRYELDIAKAGAALAKAASDSAGVPEAAEQVATLSRQLPVYAGLVEKARVNNRQGFPVGAGYLREASELLRSDLLPAAAELYRIDTERLAAEQDDASDFPWLLTVLVLGLLAALIATQIYLRRRTNRLFNVGLVVASGAVALTVLWGAVAITAQSLLVSSGAEGTEESDILVRARIAALQARADETLTLVARGGGDKYEQEFGKLAGQLAGPDGSTGLLAKARELAEDGGAAGAVDTATDSANAWLAAHQRVRDMAGSGQYNEAVALAIDQGSEGGATAAFATLDSSLAEATDVARQSFLDDTSAGSNALTLLAPGIAVLAVVAGAGATIGIRERLREYR